MLKYARYLLLLCLLASGQAAPLKGFVDRTDDPRYREVLGRVFRLKAPFGVYAQVVERGSGPTAYRYTMEIFSGPVRAGDSKTVFWGTIPEATQIRIIGVRAQSHRSDNHYVVELIGPTDERFEGLKLEIIEAPKLPAYVKSEQADAIMQLRPMWFEEVSETAK